MNGKVDSARLALLIIMAVAGMISAAVWLPVLIGFLVNLLGRIS